MDKHGQASVEYALLLAAFTFAAVEGWHMLRPAFETLYLNISTQRAGRLGMRP